MKLLGKQLLLSVLPVVLTALATGGIGGALVKQTLSRQAERVGASELDLHERQVSGFLATKLRELELIAAVPLVQRGEVPAIRAYLDREEGRLEGIEHLYWDDLGGTVHTQAGKSFSVRDRDYYPRLARGERVLTGILESRDTGEQVALLGAPVRDPSGALVGNLVASVPLAQILALVRATRVGERGFLALFDERGRLIAAGHPEASRAPADRLVRLAAEGGRVELGGEAYLTHARPLEPGEWRLVLFQSEAELFSELRGLQVGLLWILAAALTLAVLLAFAIRRTLTGPITALIGVQRRFGAGDLEARVRAGGRDELAELAGSFDQMADRLVSELAERRRAEEALRESEARYRSLVELSPVPIYVHREGWFLFFNRAALELFGAQREEQLVGKHLVDFSVNRDPTPYEAARRKALAASGAVLRMEVRLQRLDGREIIVEGNAIDVTYGGEPARLVFCADVTERRRAEEAQRRLEERLFEAEKLESLGVLAGGVAHDFNNILGTIVGNAELALHDLPPDDPARLSVEQIREAAARAAGLTARMLAYAGKGRLRPQGAELDVVLSEMAPRFGLPPTSAVLPEARLSGAGLSVEVDLAQLRELVRQLVANAAEALGPEGGRIEIATWRAELEAAELAAFSLPGSSLAPGSYACLEVRDEGCGMDEPTRAKVFEPFFSTKFVGRGLGLAAALGIARSHRGGIRLESEPGKGTRVVVCLPLSAIGA